MILFWCLIGSLLLMSSCKILRINTTGRNLIAAGAAIQKDSDSDRDLVLAFDKHQAHWMFYSGKTCFSFFPGGNDQELLRQIDLKVAQYQWGVSRLYVAVSNISDDWADKIAAATLQIPGRSILFRAKADRRGRKGMIVLRQLFPARYEIASKKQKTFPGTPLWDGKCADAQQLKKKFKNEISKGFYSATQDWEKMPEEWTVNFSHFGINQATKPGVEMNVIRSSPSAPPRLQIRSDQKMALVLSRKVKWANDVCRIAFESDQRRDVEIGWYFYNAEGQFMRYELGAVVVAEPGEMLAVTVPVLSVPANAVWWSPVIGFSPGQWLLGEFHVVSGAPDDNKKK